MATAAHPKPPRAACEFVHAVAAAAQGSDRALLSVAHRCACGDPIAFEASRCGWCAAAEAARWGYDGSGGRPEPTETPWQAAVRARRARDVERGGRGDGR